MHLKPTVAKKPRHLLIVEDNTLQAFALQRLLERNDFHVIHANTGHEALALLEVHPCDLVLCEAALPGMNGLELSRAIKTDPRWHGLPVLLLTALSDLEGFIQVLESRADGFVNKPYHHRYLVERVHALVEASEQPFISDSPEQGLHLIADANPRPIPVDRRRLMSLLLTTFEDALRQYRELSHAQAELNQTNEQLRRQSESLKASERNLRTLLEHNVDGIVLVDRHRQVRFVNTSAEVLLRRPAAELMGKPFEYPLRPDDTAEIEVVRPGWESLTVELRVVDTVWEGQPAYLALLRDITQRAKDQQKIADQQNKLELSNQYLREQSQRLESSQKNFRAVLENNADGIIIVDPAGKVLFVNTAGQLLLRLPESGLVGRGFPFPLKPDQIEEVQIAAPGWEPIVAELRVADVVWEETPAYLAMLRDITQRKRDEQKIKEQQEALQRANAQLQMLATHDGLTGLKNYRSFRERLSEQWKQCATERRPLSLLLLDVDHFKAYNDTFGHPAGDRVLKRIAVILSDCARADDLPARYGGEEFALIAPNTGPQKAKELADNLCHAVAAARWEKRSITVSIGIATMTETLSSADELVAAADGALYHSKGAGRNRATHVMELEGRGERSKSPSL